MNDQEAFDTVATHLATQTTQSIGPDTDGIYNCMYRGPNGLKCAVGALLPDGMIDERQNMYAVIELLDDNDDARALLSDVSLGLLGSLQRVHDDARNWDKGGFMGWADLRAIAADRALFLGIVAGK